MPQVSIPNYNPPIEGKRAVVVYSPTVLITDLAPVGATEVVVAVGDSIPLRRQTEIISAIKFLADGIRDRNLLEVQFKGAALYTSVNINRITSSGRLTASDPATPQLLGAERVIIAMGATATDKQHVMPLDTAFETMTKVLLENLKDQAA